jgi:hypothetical protein
MWDWAVEAVPIKFIPSVVDENGWFEWFDEVGKVGQAVYPLARFRQGDR